ncbi:hypothetical protein GGI12_000676 [Dipsacomyces acuminosporus]|nr:hypothetical protein GGI12_000676 [Dipsacomyces acuminosporus]
MTNTGATADSSLEASGVLVNHEKAGLNEQEKQERQEKQEKQEKQEQGPAAATENKAVNGEKKQGGASRPQPKSNHILALALRRMLKGPAPTLDHLNRFLSTGSGHDKFWMLIQYTTKVVVWLYAKRGHASTSERVRVLSNLVSDYRIMIRLIGLAPMAQYIRYAEQFPAQTKLLQWLDRVMNFTLVCYYPLEHIYWLGAHKIMPFSDKLVDDAGYWSCRFWAVWVALQFVHLGEEYRLIKSRKQKIYTEGKKDAAKMQEELDAVEADAKSWKIQLLINACYFPLTLHWSIRGSTFPDVAVGVFGSIAAIAQAYNVWQSTA